MSIKIVHISDLHISEHLLRAPQRQFRLPHRYGHDVQRFLALDGFLKNNEWDLLLITGDVSRIGNIESFEGLRNWLENEIFFGETKIGLNLSKSGSRRYQIIPGNRDRFNGNLTQGSLDNYHSEFDTVRSGGISTLDVNGERINIHYFDSTTQQGGFAHGHIDQRDMVAKNLSKTEINFALLHHHFLQPPKHPREISTEITNSAQVAAYMLNTGFDGIFFGHTHMSYIGRPSVEILTGLLHDRRKKPRLLKRLMPMWLVRHVEDACLVSYERTTAKNGQYPTLSAYFDYLYLKQQRYKIAGPEDFMTIREFYDQMNKITTTSPISDLLERIRKNRILISLAPSACQAEAKWHGFHVIDAERNPENGELMFEWKRYQFNGANFEALPAQPYPS